MKKIIRYLKDYFRTLDKRILAFSLIFIGILIYLNYHNSLTSNFPKKPFGRAWLSWYLLFLFTFSLGYILVASFRKASLFKQKGFLLLLFMAPMIFAWKMVYHVHVPVAGDPLLNAYWNNVIYYPFKFIIVATVLYFIWNWQKQPEDFYGLRTRNFNRKPYLIMLAIMVPLIALAATQPDFLRQYPRLQSIAFLKEANTGWYKLLYELSYGSDFLTIELFFRGFLILAFLKYAGKEAILPMAMFYCTIHFGKPLGECISSYFGGLILGVVIYHSRTIFGGLIVHLGIAWMMEFGGYLGNIYFK